MLSRRQVNSARALWPTVLIAAAAYLRACLCQSREADCAYTFNSPTGARRVQPSSSAASALGGGAFPHVRHAHFRAFDDGGPVAAVVGIRVGSDLYWYASDESNTVRAFRHNASEPASQPVFQAQYHPPGALFVARSAFALVPGGSALTHPVCAPGGHMLSINDRGDIQLSDREGTVLHSRAVRALPDARLVLNADRTLVACMCDARTGGSGLLGDRIEARQIKLVRSFDLVDYAVINASSNGVFEGTTPMFADLDGDGRDELVVSHASRADGSRVMVFDETGRLRAATPAKSVLGRQWHQPLAAGRFVPPANGGPPTGGLQLATMRAPHRHGTVHVYALQGDTLRLVAERSGYSTHRIGSRNVDMCVAGDFDADGGDELVVPDAVRGRLVGLSGGRAGGGLQEAWSLGLNGARLSSNLAAFAGPGGRLVLAAGLSNGTVIAFLPEAG